MAANAAAPAYPVRFTVDTPAEPRNRATVFFRVIVAIPIVILLATISGGSFTWTTDEGGQAAAAAGGFLVLAPLLMILFREKYPRWWFDWNVALWQFENRVVSFLALLRDEYPATDDEQAVHLEVDYPDVPQDLNRFLPLVKWLLAIPHYIVLIFLSIGAFVAVIVAWFAVLFTGRYPQGLFDFVVGVMRWHIRVQGYALLLVTDRYPPFSLEP